MGKHERDARRACELMGVKFHSLHTLQNEGCFTLYYTCGSTGQPRAVSERAFTKLVWLADEADKAIEASGVRKHKTHEECVGCGCMCVDLQTCMALVVHERDKALEALRPEPRHPGSHA